MEEQKYGTSPKMSFLLGLFAGLAVIGLAGFFMTLPRALSCNTETASDSTAIVEVEDNNAEVEEGIVEKPAEKVQPTQPVVAAGKVAPVKDTEYVKGDKNAKVTLIEYSDFQCPYCARHASTVDKVMEEYAGKVKLVFRHFPLSFHPEAQKASEATECAGEQGKFWEMHDKVFEANTNKNMKVETWKSAAKELGLNTSQFNTCLDTGKYEDKVKSDFTEGQSVGVKGTPATFINGEMVSGAVPFEKFQEIIDKYLK